MINTFSTKSSCWLVGSCNSQWVVSIIWRSQSWKVEINTENPKGSSCRLKMTFSNTEDGSLEPWKVQHELHNKMDQQWWQGQWGLQVSAQPLQLHLVTVMCPMEGEGKKKGYIWYDCFDCLRFKSSTESFQRAEGSMIYTKSYKPFIVHFEQNGHQCYLPLENSVSYFIYICSSLCF